MGSYVGNVRQKHFYMQFVSVNLFTHFGKKVLEYIRKWLGLMVPVSPRACLLGDQTELPNISKYDFGEINVGVVGVILR